MTDKMDEVIAGQTRLTEAVTNLVTTLSGKTLVENQTVEPKAATPDAVDAALKERMAHVEKAEAEIASAKLGESVSADLRARALRGEDVTEGIALAKKVLAEASGSNGGGSNSDGAWKDASQRLAEAHVGATNGNGDLVFEVPGFGVVR